MEEVIYQTDIPGALMVPVGRDVPNPLALLSNHHFKDLLDALAQEKRQRADAAARGDFRVRLD